MPSDSQVQRLYRVVGHKVRAARERAGLTQQQLSESVGVTRTSVTNLELGRQRFPLHQLLGIAFALKVDLQELIPSSNELEAPAGTVQFSVGKTVKDVSAQTAAVLQEILGGELRGSKR